MQYGIVGDSQMTELPQTEVDEAALHEEKLKSKFSRTREFKEQQQWIEERIRFYQTMLPDGRPLTSVDSPERGQQWVIANAVIGEFQLFLNRYQYANEVVKDAAK